MEDYWTCLKSYLKKENIPFNKSETTLLISFPAVQLWLASIETHLKIIKYENLETILSYQNRYINFSQLKSRLYHATKIEDWPSYVYVKDKLRDKNEIISPLDFMTWAKEWLPKRESKGIFSQALKECVNDFLQSAQSITDLRLKGQDWLKLLKFFLRKKERKIHTESPEGINCLSFNALSWVEADFIYIAGLSEQNLKTNNHNILSSLSARSITEDLGFFIKSEPPDKLEQVISCFIRQGHKALTLSFSSSDFSGTPFKSLLPVAGKSHRTGKKYPSI